MAFVLENSEPPKKMFLSDNGNFQGLRLSLGHFGQQAPESLVSQHQNGVSTSPLHSPIPTFCQNLPKQNLPWNCLNVTKHTIHKLGCRWGVNFSSINQKKEKVKKMA